MNYSAIARKTTWTLFLAQSLGSAGFIAAATINAIVGARLGQNLVWAGLPSAVYLFGSALSALGWGYTMERIGRRRGLSLGLLFGVVGAALAVAAIQTQSFILFLCGLALMGIAQAAVQLGRFAAAEVHPPAERGRAISNVVLGGTAGAVFGPLLVGPTGQLATGVGFDELTGAFMASAALFVLASLLIFIQLRPDPRDVGRELAHLYASNSPADNHARPVLAIFRTPGPLVALMAMVIGQVVMVMLMAITSLHMKGHNHALASIASVISAHTFGMFAFSVISGRLSDRFGRKPVIVAGAITLVLACVAATLSPEVLPLAVALFLLGLGWNFCFVGGSSLLSDHLSPPERAKTQGFNDLLIGLASALGSLGSGVAFATLGYNAMGYLGAAMALVPLTMALVGQMSKKRLAAAQP